MCSIDVVVVVDGRSVSESRQLEVLDPGTRQNGLRVHKT